MKAAATTICVLLVLALQGCEVYRLGISNSGLDSATDTDAVVDLASVQGELHIWYILPFWETAVPGSNKQVHYRMYFHLDRASQTATLYRIESDWSRKSPLPAPTSTPPAPRHRVLFTSDAADAPTELGMPPRYGYWPYAADAQEVEGRWIILRKHDPGYADYSLYCDKRRFASVKGLRLGLDGDDPRRDCSMEYFTWDFARRYIVFWRGIPNYQWGTNVPEIGVWHYDRPDAPLERYNTNLDKYFIWHGHQYDVREEYKSLLH